MSQPGNSARICTIVRSDKVRVIRLSSGNSCMGVAGAEAGGRTRCVCLGDGVQSWGSPSPAYSRRTHVNQRLARAVGTHGKRKAWKFVLADDAKDFKFEPAVGSFRAGFLKQDRHGNREAV